jgi:Spy/CpxP family protein refolding chaperone
MKLPWKYILVSLVIGLLVGATSGLCIMRYHMHYRRGGPEQLLNRFSHSLKLTDSQKVQVKSILEDKQKDFEQVRNSTRTEIRKVLTSEQQTKFDEINAKRDARWK